MKTYILLKGTIILRRPELWREWSIPSWSVFVTTREVRFTDADIARYWPGCTAAEYIFNLPENNTLYRQIRVHADQLQIIEEP
jgi:hypothetical protein